MEGRKVRTFSLMDYEVGRLHASERTEAHIEVINFGLASLHVHNVRRRRQDFGGPKAFSDFLLS